MQSLVIRRAVPGDAAQLAQLAARTFKDTFAAANSAEDMAKHLAKTYGSAQQGIEIASRDMHTLLVEDAGVAIAYAQLRRDLMPDCVRGHAPIELWRFYVDTPAIGRGVAQRLMAAVNDAALAAGADTLWLGVWEHNARALAFYRKCGFHLVGSHVFVLGSDPQTDLIMQRGIKQNELAG